MLLLIGVTLETRLTILHQAGLGGSRGQEGAGQRGYLPNDLVICYITRSVIPYWLTTDPVADHHMRYQRSHATGIGGLSWA